MHVDNANIHTQVFFSIQHNSAGFCVFHFNRTVAHIVPYKLTECLYEIHCHKVQHKARIAQSLDCANCWICTLSFSFSLVGTPMISRGTVYFRIPSYRIARNAIFAFNFTHSVFSFCIYFFIS